MGQQGVVGDLFRLELKAERGRRGLTQAGLAEVVHERYDLPVYRSTIAKIESGERDVRIDELMAFADLFGVSVDTLLGRAGTGTDAVWAASRLTSEAQRMVADVQAMHAKLEAGVSELRTYAEQDRKFVSAQGLIHDSEMALAVFIVLRDKLVAVGGEWPIPGISLDRP